MGWDASAVVRSLHPDFCTQGQSNVKEGVSHPIHPLPHSGALLLGPVFHSPRPLHPRVSSGSRMPCLHHFSFYRTPCLCCFSCLWPQCLSIPWLQGSWCPPVLSSDCLWPIKGAHVRTVHSSASTPARYHLAAWCPQPASAHVCVFLLQL